MSLDFIKGSKDEVVIDEQDIAEEVDYWSCTLVGTVMGCKTTIAELNTLVGKHWNHITTPEILYFSRGWYYFRFLSKEDMASVQAESWNINGYPLVASFVGTPICADETTTNKSKTAFARVLVEVDISKELPKAMALQTPYRGKILQKIVYEWVPYYCQTCKKIGHTKEKCNRNAPKKVYQPAKVVVAAPPVSKPVTKAHEDIPASPTPRSSSTKDDSSCTTPLRNRFSVIQPQEGPVSVHLAVDQGIVGAQYALCTVTHILSQKSFLVTFVYAFNRAVERLPFWNRLISFSQGHKIPWVCLGDFNVSLAAEERSGCLLHLREIQEFRDCLTACQLVDHPYTGGVFAWHNKQPANPKWAKLDRALLNYEWFHYLPSSTVDFLPAGISDHAPLLMDIDPSIRPPPKSFRYLNCWALSASFSSCVSQIWSSSTGGGQIYSLFAKLGLLKSELRHIHRYT
ncbi:uncharacterized protein LOC141618086 [Silene latifolia]|uniref:uncharacterized protein LOC141618086 n=1 Tax=Silene latifolia TaxID=37657 RepID=UPI003D76A587